jgi:pimeloyl-ACP methyl ester carboxylesterase
VRHSDGVVVKRVEVRGRLLHAQIAGDGAPTVVLEAGFPGGVSTDWHFVVPLVAEDSTVVAYDRAGMGLSADDPRPRTARTIVEDLHSLLTVLNLPGPFVLVGHSGGGLLVRAFRMIHPALVAGIVLIDSSHEHQLARLPAARTAIDAMRVHLKRRAVLARTGVTGLIAAALGKRAVARARRLLPRPVRRSVAASQATHRYATNALRELEAIHHVTDYLRTHNPSLGSLPLAVVSAGRNRVPGWDVLQAELAELSSKSDHRTLPDVGHDIPLEAPGEVASSIRHVLYGIKAQHGGPP